jgi:hypothetical protein
VSKCHSIARKFYKKYSTNIIRLAISVQKAWKRCQAKLAKNRAEDKATLRKIVLIQSLIRGKLTRKRMKKNMIKRLTVNDTYFQSMRLKMMAD